MNLCSGEHNHLAADILSIAFLSYMKIEHSLGKTRFGSVLGLVLLPLSSILKLRKNQGQVPAEKEEEK